MKTIFLRATKPVLIYLVLLGVLVLVIGGDKWQFAVQVFGLPWSYLFELDPYVDHSSLVEFLSHYGGVFLNSGIIYAIALLLRKKSTGE